MVVLIAILNRILIGSNIKTLDMLTLGEKTQLGKMATDVMDGGRGMRSLFPLL